MKYNEFTGSETIVEAQDVIAVAKMIIKNLPDVSSDVSKELNLAITNLDAAEMYLHQIKNKYDIALGFVSDDIKKQKSL